MTETLNEALERAARAETALLLLQDQYKALREAAQGVLAWRDDERLTPHDEGCPYVQDPKMYDCECEHGPLLILRDALDAKVPEYTVKELPSGYILARLQELVETPLNTPNAADNLCIEVDTAIVRSHLYKEVRRVVRNVLHLIKAENKLTTATVLLEQIDEGNVSSPLSLPLDFDELQRISVLRCESEGPNGFNHKLADWSILEWAGAMAGEAGEATNVAKKMRRQRKQRDDDKVTAEQLGDELADNVCYAVLTAAKAGLDLGEAIVKKFNQISDENGFPYKLRGKAAP